MQTLVPAVRPCSRAAMQPCGRVALRLTSKDPAGQSGLAEQAGQSK